ncbi:hypothetical protein ZOSMA_67G00200 [Zostera marina]|uniref:Uncharacterized protein n=1 Tax=Zostera marina TaxID=29655 RepID=A0A0K9NSF0_ZOSMR|nr:hypothetical protein ZOSMA_67G00200 [Zostera marina]
MSMPASIYIPTCHLLKFFYKYVYNACALVITIKLGVEVKLSTMAFLGRSVLISFLLALLASVNIGFVIGAKEEAKQLSPIKCPRGYPIEGNCYNDCYESTYNDVEFCECYYEECYLK